MEFWVGSRTLVPIWIRIQSYIINFKEKIQKNLQRKQISSNIFFNLKCFSFFILFSPVWSHNTAPRNKKSIILIYSSTAFVHLNPKTKTWCLTAAWSSRAQSQYWTRTGSGLSSGWPWWLTSCASSRTTLPWRPACGQAACARLAWRTSGRDLVGATAGWAV